MSQAPSTSRPAAEERLGNEARMAHSRLRRAEKRRDDAEEDAADARHVLDRLHRAACERFGFDWPTDALLLDVLASIDIDPIGEHPKDSPWRWRGLRNNKNLATLRVRPSGERSLVRYLAESVGLIAEDDWGMLYPTNGDPDDVNPWHRTLRRTPAPLGNRFRWGTETPE